MEEIILWECDCETIRACELALQEALKKAGMRAVITVNSEPPLIARHQLWKRLPVLEIRGLHFSLRPGCAFTAEELTRLFATLMAERTGGDPDRNPGGGPEEISPGLFRADERRNPVEALLLTDADFQSKLERATGLLLFYKKQCPNCKALEKVIEKFRAANPHVPYLRVDSEESPGAMRAFGVERVPTVLALKDGQVAARKVGLMNLREMTEFYPQG